MKRRTTIGEDPLDAVIPPLGAAEGKAPAARRGGTASGDPGGAAARRQRGAAETPAAAAQGPQPEAAAPAAAPGTVWMDRAGDAAAAHTSTRQYLTFLAGGDEFAVEILRVREILQPVPITRVPMTPPWVRGVMNLRGTVLPVVDLAVKLGLGESGLGARSCIVIVEVELWEEVQVFGVLVDAVSQVVELGEGDVEEPPAFGTRIHLDYLLGMGRLGEELVLLLDVDRVLSEAELRLAAAIEAPEEAAEHEEGAGDTDSGAS